MLSRPVAASTKQVVPEVDFESDITLEYEMTQISEIAHEQKFDTDISSFLENNAINSDFSVINKSK